MITRFMPLLNRKNSEPFTFGVLLPLGPYLLYLFVSVLEFLNIQKKEGNSKDIFKKYNFFFYIANTFILGNW